MIAQLHTQLPDSLPRATPFEVVDTLIERDVVAKCCQAAVKKRLLLVSPEILGEAKSATGRQPPVGGIVRDGFEMFVPEEHCRSGLGPPGRDARIAVG
jgi:hypothetical protein